MEKNYSNEMSQFLTEKNSAYKTSRTRLTTLIVALLLFLVAGILNVCQGQIYVNTFTGASACPTNGNTPSMATNSTGAALTRNTITCQSTANVFNSTTLNVTSSVSNTSYIEFSATANSGYQLNLTSLSFFRQASNSAPNQLEVRYSTDGFSTSTSWGAAPVSPTTGTTATWDFADFSTSSGGTVTFRVYPYGTTRADLTTPAVATGTFRLDDVTINGTVTSSSSISVGALTPSGSFTTTVGTPSSSKTFSLTGTGLTSNLTVAAVSGYEYSDDGFATAGQSSLTYSTASVSKTISVRLTGASTGTFNGTVTITSTGASGSPNTSISLTGTVNSLTPTISVGSLTPGTSFTATTGTPSSAQTFTLSGTNLSANLTVSAVTGYEYSDDGFATAGQSSLTYSTATVSKTISVRLTAASAGTFNGTINIASTGATGSPSTISLTGSVTDPVPTISVGSLTPAGSFSTVVATPSTVKTFTLTGSALTANLTVSAVSGYEYSDDGFATAGQSSLTYITASVSKTISVRLTGATVGTYSGTITIASAGATGSPNTSISLTGTVNNPATTLVAGDIAVIGYNTNGTPDNFAIVVLKDLYAGTVFYINDNEVASAGGATFTDLAEQEASFTVKPDQTIPAGTVIVLPWGTTAVSTSTYDYSTTSSAGLGNNNDEIYIYTASSITATTPTAFIYFAKIGTSTSSVPSGLTLGSTAIAPSGPALRYSTSGALYSECKTNLLSAIATTSSLWNSTGATTIAAGDWTFTVNATCTPTILVGSISSSIFSTPIGTPSTPVSTFTLNAFGLSSNLTVSALAGYEYSDDGFTTAGQSSLTYSVTNVTKTISVRLTGTTAGTYNGNITIASTGATGSPANISVTGSVLVPSIAFSNASPVAGSINQNSNNNILYSIQCVVTNTSANLNSISFNTAGTYSVSDLKANGFRVWFNNTNDLNTPTQLGTDQAIVSSGNTITVSGLSQSFPVGTSYILVTADVFYNANTSNNINITSTPFSNLTFAIGTLTGTDPVAAGNSQTFAAVIPTITISQATTSPAASNVNYPSTNTLLDAFKFDIVGNATDINSVSVTTAGTYTSVDFVANSFKLWYNTTNSFAGATQIGTSQAVPSSGGIVTFGGLNQFASGAVFVWITVDAAATAVNGHTINITSTPFSSLIFSQGTLLGTNPVIAGTVQTLAGIPLLTELILPQYIQGVSGTNINRVPFAYRAALSNLLPSATYRYIACVVLSTDGATSTGAGNAIYAPAGGGSFVRSSGPNLTTAGNYGTFTTDALGNYTGWFIIEPTANATRFVPGNNLFMRIVTNDGGSGTTAVNYLTTTNTAKVVNLVGSAGVNNASGLRGNSFATDKNFIFAYDNVSGTGRPISGTFVESDGSANTTGNSYASFYGTSVDAVSGAYGLVIPNTNANGIQRIEHRDFSSGNILGCAATDADGVWPSGVNTVNPTSGTTALVITNTDAPLSPNTSVGGSVSSSTNVCNGLNSGTLNLSGQTGTVLKWQYSTDNFVSDINDIANTTTSQSYSNLTQTTYYRAVVQFSPCPSANSSVATITVNPVTVGGSVTSNATVCSGSNSGTLNLGGQTGSILKWQYSTDNFVSDINDIANVTTSQAYLNLTQTTSYRAVVQSGVCSSANSSFATITVNPVTVGGSVTSNATVCSGSNGGTLNLGGQTGSILKWQYSTDNFLSDINDIANVTTSQAYLNLTQTTSYRAVVQSGVCSSANSIAATITVNPVTIGGNVSSSTAVCNGSNSGTLSLSGQTGSVVKWQYSTDNFVSDINDIANVTTSQSYLNLAQTTSYRAVVQSGACASANSSAATITILSAGINWSGSVSTDWFNAANWCGGIPTSTTDVVISSASSNMPLINASGAVCRNITLNSGASLSIDSVGYLTVNGDWSNSGTITANGTVNFAGSVAQSITGTSTFNNFILNNSLDLTLNSSITVNGTAQLLAGKILTGSNNITISNGGTLNATSTSYVNGNLKKYIASGGSVNMDYEIGSATAYTPVSVNFNQVFIGDYLLVNTVSSDHPLLASSGFNATKTVNRYWNLTSTGLTFDTYDADFTFVTADKDAGFIEMYAGAKVRTTTSWTIPPQNSDSTNIHSISGATSLGAVQIGVFNPTPLALSLAPSDVYLGQTTNIVFNGRGFISGVTTVNSVTGITTNSTTINNDSTLTLNVTVSPTAILGTRKYAVKNIINNPPEGGTSDSLTVTVREFPNADFYANRTVITCNLGETVEFDNYSTDGASYSWNFGAGASPATATGFGPFTVTYSTLGNKTVQLIAFSPIGNDTLTRTNYIAVNANAPATPASITGLTSVCPGTSSSYTVPLVSGVTSYNWTLPTGVTYVSGAGTRTVMLAFAPTFTTGNILVTQTSLCGTSSPKTITVSGTPATPASITGPLNVCSVTSATYTVAAVSGATSYTWILPTGVTSPLGASPVTIAASGTNTILVNFDVTFTSGNISAKANTACASGALKTIAVSRVLGSPLTLTGITSGLCPSGVASAVYTCGAVAGATTYTWTAPAGAIVTAGAGTTSATISFGASFTSGNISVTAGSSCGTSVAKTLAVKSVLTAPTTLTGITTGLCPSGVASTNYTTTAVTGATSYTWTAPAGATVTAGQGTLVATISFGASFTTGNVSVVATNACGNSPAKTLAVKSTITAPTTLTGITTGLCPSGVASTNYTTTAVTGATSYTWTAPTGATVTAGQGTLVATISFGASFTTGNVSVVATNACGSSTAKTLAVRSTLLAPTTLTGATTGLCPSGIASTTYTTTAVTGATGYTWTAPAGATVTAGQGTLVATISFGASFTTGNVSVVATNACGSSTAKTLAVRNTLLPPTTITGVTTGLCPYGVASTTYTATAVAGATSYTWTAPAGATVTAGQGTLTATISFSPAFTSGSISVKADNACGSSAAKTLVVYSTLLTPGVISGSTVVCANSTGNTYSILPVSGATSYLWTVPTGATIVSGAGTNSIVVDFSSSVAGGITVKAVNACGNGLVRSLTLSMTCMGTTYSDSKAMVENTSTFTADLYPNPTLENLNMNFVSDSDKDILVEIFNALGSKVSSQTYSITAGENTLNTSVSEYTKGLYFVHITDVFTNEVLNKTFIKQ